MPMVTDSTLRIQTLKEILLDGQSSTQDELREALEKKNFSVTQSTISRDLKRVGAIKMTDTQGRTVYKLGDEYLNSPAVPGPVANSIKDLVTAVQSNGVMIVIHTSPGSASLIARHLDAQLGGGILGTIAGDDTIFVAPANVKTISATFDAIQEAFLHPGQNN